MKNHVRGVKYLALAMIYLVISIVFISANALAIFSYNVTGGDGVKGFRAAEDSVEIKAIADYNVSIVNPEGVETQMICTNTTPKNCEWFDPWSSTEYNEFLFIVRHYITTPKDYNAYLLVDRLEPVFTNFNITKISSGIKIAYAIKDYAYDKNLPNCSGLDRLDYEIDGVTPDTILLNTTPNKCFIEGSFSVAVQPGYYPDFRVALTAYDNVGNSNNTAIELPLDFQAPVIQDNFEIMSGGHEIEIFSIQGEVIGDVVIHIDDANLNRNKVYGDLRKLHDSNAINNGYKNKTATCTPETQDNLTYKCVFPGIKIRPVSETLSIIITAFDNDDNAALKELTKTITLLNDPGAPTYIGPIKTQCTADLSLCHTHSGTNTFYLDLPATSNYSKSKVDLVVGGTPTFSICQPEEDKWVCKAPINIPSTSTVSLAVAYGSVDDYGNPVPNIKRDVKIDDTPPAIIGTLNTDTPSCALDGTLTLTLKVLEATSPELKIFVNTSEFTLDDTQYGECTESAPEEWDCSITLTNFQSEYKNIDGFVIIQDLAGNKLSIPHTFEVCIENTQATPNVISSIKAGDITVDRRTASFTGVKNYVPLTLTLSRSDASVLGLVLENCRALTPDGQDVIGQDRGYFLTTTGLKPLMAVYVGYEGAILPESSLDINCTLSARIRVKDTIYSNPEVKDFTIKALTKNNPLGTVDAATQSEISTQKARLRDLDSTIEDYQKWETTLGAFCDIAEYVGIINSLLQAIKAVVYGVLLALDLSAGWTGIGHAAVNAAWAATQKVTGAFHTFATYLWPPGMLPVSVGSVVKYVCMIYTCKHLDFGTYLNIAMDLGVSGSLNVLGTDNGVRFAGENSMPFEMTNTPLSQDVLDSFQENVLTRNEQLIDGLNQHQWVLNPYKSTHWDNTCAPAILYNSKKEKQLTCKYVSCLENAVGLGLPKAMCDAEDKYNTCLYLDSAEWVVSRKSTGQAILEGLGKAVMNNLVGIGLTLAYMIACWNYYIPGGYLSHMEFIHGGPASSWCGVTGAYLGLKEIYEFFNNDLLSFADDNPVPGDKDYCANVKYQNEE